MCFLKLRLYEPKIFIFCKKEKLSNNSRLKIISSLSYSLKLFFFFLNTLSPKEIFYDQIFFEACVQNKKEILKFLIDRGYKTSWQFENPDFTLGAFSSGIADLIDYALSYTSLEDSDQPERRCFDSENKAIVFYLLLHDFSDKRMILNRAARRNMTDIIDYILKHYSDTKTNGVLNSALKGAVMGGHIKLSDYFISMISKNNIYWVNALRGAAKGGKNYMVDYVLKKIEQYGFSANDYEDIPGDTKLEFALHQASLEARFYREYDTEKYIKEKYDKLRNGY